MRWHTPRWRLVRFACLAQSSGSARSVFRGKRWSRGPAVATQLILLPLALSFAGGGTTWISVVLAVLAVTVLVGVLHPRSTAVFVGSPADKPQL